MNKMKMLLFGLIVAIGLGGLAYAQAGTDAGAGQAETSVPFTASITAGTVATVVSATSGKAVNVRALTITNTASGYVRLYSKDATTGANLIGTFGVIANTPLPLTQEHLRAGICTRVGEALVVDATTGTVSIQADIRLDAKSPKQ